jgi:hypothetical protein
MNFKQFYLGCLAHASYYIGSEKEAAVIDPQRDVQQYIDEATANGQTNFHNTRSNGSYPAIAYVAISGTAEKPPCSTGVRVQCV